MTITKHPVARRWLPACVARLVLTVGAGFPCAARETAALPALHIEDGRIVDEQKVPVTLRGCNLGNWHPFARAGVMVRGSLERGAAHAVLTAFPSGQFTRMDPGNPTPKASEPLAA